MVDITLYGHLTFDRIFDKFSYDTSVGSMGNVWKNLNYLNSNLNIKLSPTEIGEALILVNKNKSERSSIANLSLYKQQPLIYPSKWNHILYINELQDISFIKQLKNIVSADICRGNKLKNLDILKHIDYLFISDEDLFTDINNLVSKIRKAIIYHTSSGSKIYTKNNKVIETKVKILNNINVLGAGDLLASCFIDEHLNNSDLKKSIQKAHKKVTTILKKQLNEN
tara:strand:+ start:454 stop:1128 length:675 start_codon:yes stop_codon:yes gene_type:complete